MFDEFIEHKYIKYKFDSESWISVKIYELS